MYKASSVGCTRITLTAHTVLLKLHASLIEKDRFDPSYNQVCNRKTWVQIQAKLKASFFPQNDFNLFKPKLRKPILSVVQSNVGFSTWDRATFWINFFDSIYHICIYTRVCGIEVIKWTRIFFFYFSIDFNRFYFSMYFSFSSLK